LESSADFAKISVVLGNISVTVILRKLVVPNLMRKMTFKIYMLLLLAHTAASNNYPVFFLPESVVLDISKETNKILSGESKNLSIFEKMIPRSRKNILLIELGILP